MSFTVQYTSLHNYLISQNVLYFSKLFHLIRLNKGKKYCEASAVLSFFVFCFCFVSVLFFCSFFFFFLLWTLLLLPLRFFFFFSFSESYTSRQNETKRDSLLKSASFFFRQLFHMSDERMIMKTLKGAAPDLYTY